MATRGRKPTIAPAAEPEVLDAAAEQHTAQALAAVRQDATAQALAVSQHDAAVRAVAAQVGYQLPADCTDPDLIQRDISANMRRSVEACLEVGRGLTVLKQACQHGQFIARLEVLGLDRYVAARFIQAATKFSNVPMSAHLTQAIGTQSKLLEMLVLDDEQIEDLALTGQTGELSLDDVATMSVKELRAKLRDARAENKAQAELLAEKNADLDEMRAKSKLINPPPPDERRAELLQEVSTHVNTALGMLNGAVTQSFAVLADHDAIAGQDSLQIMGGYVAQLQQAILQLREMFDLPDIVGDGTPEWMRATADDADLAAAEA
ncbi:hypothetical protein ACNQFN_18815 [Thauera butanivorans]|uniref:hypothetical protein n=1 Tax=Thauera butanivorans TaxID=86174 RepID=UPI003AB5DDEF